MHDSETIARLWPRTLVLLALVAPAIGLTIALVLAERRGIRIADSAEKAIPATIVAPDRVWTSTSMTFSEAEMEILETRDYVFRTYTDGSIGSAGGPVDLCVVFSQDNRKGTHPPDVCLEASGYRILSRADRTLAIGNVDLSLRELVATTGGAGGDRYFYFAYFYKCGDEFTPSFYRQQIQIVWNGLTRRNASGALIRFSTPMDGYGDLPAARERTDQLLKATFPYLRKDLGPG